MRKLVSMAVAFAVVTALLPAAAEAKTKHINTSIDVDVFGIIDRHGAVKYAWDAEVGAGGYAFACMGGREVKLFRVEPNGAATQVASGVTEFTSFVGMLERPLGEITGYYYAEAAPRTRKFKQGKHRKVRCLGARSPTIFVEVPAGLLPAL